jgi:hypothetical protein
MYQTHACDTLHRCVCTYPAVCVSGRSVPVWTGQPIRPVKGVAALTAGRILCAAGAKGPGCTGPAHLQCVSDTVHTLHRMLGHSRCLSTWLQSEIMLQWSPQSSAAFSIQWCVLLSSGAL